MSVWLSVDCSLLSWQLDLVLLQSLGRLGEAHLIAVSLNSFMAVLNSSHCCLLDVGSFGISVILAFSIFSGDVKVLTPSRKELHQHSVYFTGVSTDTIGNKV